MTTRAFIDTNVLVYAIDDGEPAKQRQARALLAGAAPGSLVISAQVLGELYVVATGKLGIAVETAAALIDDLRPLPVVAIDAGLVASAITTSRSAQLSYWDALIVEAAALGGCRRLLTEDLADGATIAGVSISNPFRQASA